jgi:hypothetical protein
VQQHLQLLPRQKLNGHGARRQELMLVLLTRQA